MRIFIQLFILVTAFLLLLNCTTDAPEKPNADGSPDTRKLRLLSAMDELAKMRFVRGNDDAEEIKGKHLEIDKIVARFENPEDISLLAMLSRSMARHCQFVECKMQSEIEPVFDSAFWACIKRLSKDKEENREVLERVRYMATLNGTENGDWERLTEGKEFP